MTVRGKFSVFIVARYVVKPEKHGDFMSLYEKYREDIRQHPEVFGEIKSYKLFVEMFGGIAGAYWVMIEYANQEDLAKSMTKIGNYKGWEKTYQELQPLLDPLGFVRNIWNLVMEVK